MKILLADDHVLFREGLRMVLENTAQKPLTVVEADDFIHALSISREQKDFDIALVDFFMPGMDGSAGVNALRKQLPQSALVVLSASEDPRDVGRALDAGAKAYIAKSCGSRLLLEGLQKVVVADRPYVLPESLAPLGRNSSRINDVFPNLTRRQIDVLAMVAKGRSNKEIARELNLAEITVKLHVTAILKALNVENRTQAAIYAQRMGVH